MGMETYIDLQADYTAKATISNEPLLTRRRKPALSTISHFFTSRHLITSFMMVLLLICGSVLKESFAAESVPMWFKEGIYAEYRFDSGSVWFTNGTFVSFPKESRAKASFRWECICIKENTSRLSVTLSFDHENRDIWFSTLLDVNVKTRRVTLQNETYVGMTFLWLPPNLEENQTVTVTDGVIGNVTTVGLASSPQGLQEAFWVIGAGEVDEYMIAPNGGYDLDTGLLLQSTLWGEPTLLALGILDPGLVGRMEFTATNIDLGLGKSELGGLHAESLEVLFFFIPIVSFTVIFLIIFWRRGGRKTKRHSRGCARIRKENLKSNSVLLF